MLVATFEQKLQCLLIWRVIASFAKVGCWVVGNVAAVLQRHIGLVIGLSWFLGWPDAVRDNMGGRVA